jgi:putative Ca2+/H+ antiporter (TMEM165/GDT1 family)
LKALLAVFLTVFLAELGDKTQLATLLFATDPNLNRLGVFVASSTALMLASLVAVLLGAQISRWVSPSTLHFVAGMGFVAIGLWLLIGKG